MVYEASNSQDRCKNKSGHNTDDDLSRGALVRWLADAHIYPFTTWCEGRVRSLREKASVSTTSPHGDSLDRKAHGQQRMASSPFDTSRTSQRRVRMTVLRNFDLVGDEAAGPLDPGGTGSFT